MRSLWTDEEAAAWRGDLGLRVYTSRLLGRDRSLVLHGGGNTSVKVREPNLFGEEEEILYVKGSGWDLEKIEEAGFAPVRRDHLVRLAALDELSDPAMVNEMVTHMKRSSAPTPSVEAILHAILPHKFVDHTHADAGGAGAQPAGGGGGARARGRAARPPADTSRRPHQCRRGGRGDQHAGWRGAHPPDLRRFRGGDPLCHAGLRSRPPLRPPLSGAGRTSDDRHGADEPRDLLLRGDRAGVLRTDDPSGHPGRGVPRGRWGGLPPP